METTVCEKNKCCGCNACINICPKKCISIVDDVRALNAIINKNLCIECNLCKKVCQVVNNKSPLIELKQVLYCYDGTTKNEIINKESSSGGFATTLGQEFAKKGGYVVGVKNDKDKFYFDITNNPSEIKKFSGSKYVKVSTCSIYGSIKSKLLENEKVLFFGLPCQVAGLKLFLQKEYDNLFTIDLICHGTPSEKVLFKYLNEKGIGSTYEILFRKKNVFQLYKEGKSILPKTVCDPYTIGFLNGLFYTENCYECKYAKNERISDITIGDSWGSKNKGVNGMNSLSLILCNTQKANLLISLIENHFDYMEADFENAKKYNHQLVSPCAKQPYTDYYFEHFNDKTTKSIISKAYPKTMIKQMIKYVLIKMHLR